MNFPILNKSSNSDFSGNDVLELTSAVSDHEYRPTMFPAIGAKLMEKYKGVRTWFGSRKAESHIPASEAIIEHQTPKPPLSERIANLSGKAAEAVTSKVGQATDWTKFAAYKGFVKTHDATYKAAKGVTELGSTIGSAPTAISKSLSGISEKISNLRADAAYRSYVRKNADETEAAPEARKGLFSRVKNISSGLMNRVKSVGESLKDPQTRKQVAAEMATNMAIMGTAKLAVGSAVALANAPVVAALATMTATTGVVGGLLKSNRQYKHAKAEWEQNHEDAFQGRFDYLRSHKTDFAKNFATSAFIGAIGGAIGTGLGHAWQNFHAPVAHTASLPVEQGPVITDADTIPVAPAETVQAPAPFITMQEAQVLKDQAVHEYWHGDKTKGLAMFRQAAENGNSQAVRDYFELTGEHVQFTHIPIGADKLDTSSVSARVVTAAPDVKPSLKLDLSDVKAETTASELPAESPAFSETFKSLTEAAPTLSPETVKDATTALVGGAAITGGAVVAAPLVQSGLMAMSVATAQPQEPARRPSIVQTCQVVDVPDAPEAYQVNCPRTPLAETMIPGDSISFKYMNDEHPNVENVYLAGEASYPTKYFEQSLINDTSRFGETLKRLRGFASGLFNASADASKQTPENDNQPEVATMPKISMGRELN